MPRLLKISSIFVINSFSHFFSVLKVFFTVNNILRCGIRIKNIIDFLEKIFEGLYGSKYSRMDQVKFFKDCLPHIFLGPFLNTFTHIKILKDL